MSVTKFSDIPPMYRGFAHRKDNPPISKVKQITT